MELHKRFLAAERSLAQVADTRSYRSHQHQTPWAGNACRSFALPRLHPALIFAPQVANAGVFKTPIPGLAEAGAEVEPERRERKLVFHQGLPVGTKLLPASTGVRAGEIGSCSLPREIDAQRQGRHTGCPHYLSVSVA